MAELQDNGVVRWVLVPRLLAFGASFVVGRGDKPVAVKTVALE